MTFGETEVKAKAQELGFIACGITDLAPNLYGAALDAWLERGLAGTMRYLHRLAAKRKQPADIVAGARRAVIVLDSYGGFGSEREHRPKIAKYARGRDYHLEMGDRL